jgi:hypothetical protein
MHQHAIDRLSFDIRLCRQQEKQARTPDEASERHKTAASLSATIRFLEADRAKRLDKKLPK